MRSITGVYRAGIGSIAAVVLLLSATGRAELGGAVDSVQADQQRLRGVRQVTRAQAYETHEIRTSHNSVIREFVSPDGHVFAVSYHGPSLGESREILRSYSAQIAEGLKTIHGGRHIGGPVVLRLPGLVYEAGGHLRSYYVRAYVPERVPQGIALEALR